MSWRTNKVLNFFSKLFLYDFLEKRHLARFYCDRCGQPFFLYREWLETKEPLVHAPTSCGGSIKPKE